MADVVVIDVGGRKLAVPTAHAREVAAAGWVTPVPLALPPMATGDTVDVQFSFRY